MANDAAAYARAYVNKYGLRIVKIAPGSKAPKHADWNAPGGYFEDGDSAASFYLSNPTWNMGAVLGPSRLCSLDVDNVPETKQVLSEFGIDIDALAKEFPTVVGNPSRFRVEFSMPEGIELGRHALNWPNIDDPSKHHTVFELRSGAVQDVLPPSIHPETGRPYTWLTKPNGHFPELPESLLAIWKHWDIFLPQARQLCPWTPKPKKPPVTINEPKYRAFEGGESVIDAFNQAHDIAVMLRQFGYQECGNRWLSPHSSTKLPGVTRLDDKRVFIHHTSDPLWSDPPHPIGPFDLYCYYEHAGEVRNAVRAAAKLLGMNRRAEATKIPSLPKPEDAHEGIVPDEMAETTPPVVQMSAFEEKIAKLAKLDAQDYEVIRKTTAKEMNIRASVLDALVNAARQVQAGLDEPLVPIEQSNYYALWQNLGLDLTKSGPVCNLNNCVIVLTKFEGLVGRIWYDEFSHRINSDLFHAEGEWTDCDTLQLTLAIQRDIGMSKISSMQVREAVVLVSRKVVRNPPKEYLEGLQWDGVPRLESMLDKGWCAGNNPYTRAVGRCWMTSLVARVFEPGCKVDTVPVFEGEQGLFKSTALSIIGGKWYAECNEPMNGKDFYMILEGRLIVEIAEMHSFSVAEVRRVKGIISTRTDRYRAPYASTVEDHPRQAVLAGTTNEDDWNRDATGARRFWPVRCHSIDLEWLKVNRDQLFAEAVHLYRTKHIWHDVPSEYALTEQAARRAPDPWDTVIHDYVYRRNVVTVREIMERALDMTARDQNAMAQIRVTSILKSMGWEQRLVKRPGMEGRVRGWVRKPPKPGQVERVAAIFEQTATVDSLGEDSLEE